jgi:thymidylate synthase
MLEFRGGLAMIKVFEGTTADEVWRLAAKEFLHGNSSRHQDGRGGSTQELLHSAFTIRDPRQRWIVERQPALNPAFAIAEVVWILRGRRDSAYLNYWNSQLPKFAGSGEEYHGAYGFRLRQQFGVDQLERAYQALHHNPNGRQVVLQMWDPKADFPDTRGRPVNPDIPCNISSLLKIRDGRLEWMQILRSNDLFRGVPYNFIQFTSIQEVLAGWLGIELGSYNQLSDSLHLYDGDADLLQIGVLSGVERNSDSLGLPKEESDAVLAKVDHLIETMFAPSLSQEDLRMLLAEREIPRAFQNLLLVVAAEAARRRGWSGLAQDLMSDCSNPALTQVWKNWFTRFQR